MIYINEWFDGVEFSILDILRWDICYKDVWEGRRDQEGAMIN